MLTSIYIPQVQSILHDPNSQFYTAANLTTFINQARQQLAAESKSVRFNGTFSTAVGVQLYLLNAISSAAQPGLSTAIEARSLQLATAPFYQLEERDWDWFNFYELGAFARPPGLPRVWAPYRPGEAAATNQASGSFYIAPNPVGVYTLNVDAIWQVSNLALETDVEALTYPYTDAVQYYAAYLAYLDSQRYEDANDMLQLYEQFLQRAMKGVMSDPVPLVSRPVEGPSGPIMGQGRQG